MARHGTARVLLLGLSLLLGGLQQCKAVDGDAYWGPKGLAAGPEFFPAEGSSGSNHTATPGADTGAVTPPGAEPVAFTPLSLGLHTAAHSWCLAAVLPAALAGQRYGRGAAVKLVLDAALPSALGAAVAVYALPPPSPTFAFRYAAASGVFALAPALALLLIALRRTYGRVQWQRDHTKEKSESPSKGVIGEGADPWAPHAGGWRRWEVWALLTGCGAAQAPALLTALVERGGLLCVAHSCWAAQQPMPLLQGVASLAASNAALAALAALVAKAICARPVGKMSLGARLSLSAAMALVGACVVCVLCAR